MDWYRQTINEVLDCLEVDPQAGLTTEEAAARLTEYGKNELEEEKRAGFLRRLLAQFADFLVLILIGAAVISFLVHEPQDAFVILAIVVLNAFLGIYQEGRAEKALAALKQMSAPAATVLRSGTALLVPANTLVPGDLVLLEAGDIVPADLRLLESAGLKIDESSLTGESVPAEKHAGAVHGTELGLGDRHNMAYMSNIVTYGRGFGVVVTTGHSTEIGKIASLLQTYKEESTPLQKKLNQLGKILGIATIIICLLVLLSGLWQGRDLLEMLLVAISLAVAAIPEGLPAIVTIVLALGMNRMVKRNAIVKRLLAVETLGCTTVICSDKTGTLTQNEMTVSKVFADGRLFTVAGSGYAPEGKIILAENQAELADQPGLLDLFSAAALANDASLKTADGLYTIIGDPTEGALLTLAAKAGLAKGQLNQSHPRIAEIPFDSERKMMTSFHENYLPDSLVSFTKGAPDVIISRCSRLLENGQVVPFTDEQKQKILTVNNELAGSALRVLAFARREHSDLPAALSSDAVETDLVFLGLAGMLDPPRQEAKEAISLCSQAGIKTVMITGDYKDTAFAIAHQLGMAHDQDQILTGTELDNLSDEELKNAVNKTRVFARVSPEHKVRIVAALKANGEIAAMTGDGVNDAPALKKADIGVAMGVTGTDVAKNTADLILTDDNFASIVAAVEEGRIIYENIKKFVYFLLSCNIGEIILVFTSILLGLPVPLLPIQLLWLNLVTDSFPALALGVEKGDPEIMQQKPRDPNEPILDKSMLLGIGLQSVAIAAASLAAYLWGMRHFGPDNILAARTLAFATLTTAELFRAFSIRSSKQTVFEIGLFSNRKLVQGVAVSFLLMLAVLYLPFLNPIFHTFPPTLTHWGIIVAFGLVPFILGEAAKFLFQKKL